MIKKILLTIIMSILIPITFLFIIYSSIFTEKDILNNLEETNYYEHVYNDIKEKLKMELPNDELSYVYDNYLSIDQIKKDIKTILENYYIKSKDGIEKEFYDYVIAHFDQTDNHIKSLASSLSKIYYNNLFSIDQLDSVISKLPLKNSARAISFVLIFISILIIAIFIKNIGIYNSFIISGLLLVLPKLFVTIDDILINFYYYNNSLSYFVKNYAYSIINQLSTYGFILLVIGLIGQIMHFVFKLKLTKKVK